MDKSIEVQNPWDALKSLKGEQLQEHAYEFYKHATFLIKQQRVLFLDLGFVLKIIRDGKLYKKFNNDGYDRWSMFLADPEINMKEGTANTYIRIYEFYIEHKKMLKEEVLQIPLNRLNMMKAKLELMPPEKQDELIEKAKVLSESDFRKELIDSKIINSPKIKIYHCDKCQKLKIEYKESEICKCEGSASVHPMKNY